MLPRIAIIGGSGLGMALGGIGSGELHRIDTPFGPTSAPILVTVLDGVPVALLARHGPGHVHNPSQVPYRANLFALKALGVTHVLASAAVGSLREDLAPRELIVPDQVIDKTFRRPGTFFEELAVHVELASPFCPAVRGRLLEAGSPTRVHPRGPYVCMEGPQFSTRAESELHRSWGADVIGMTLMPEAKLAREAELCYAAVCLATDYDCWRAPRAELSQQALLAEILGNLQSATAAALALLQAALPAVQATVDEPCRCREALALAIWTDRALIPPETRERLGPLLARHLAPAGG